MCKVRLGQGQTSQVLPTLSASITTSVDNSRIQAKQVPMPMEAGRYGGSGHRAVSLCSDF